MTAQSRWALSGHRTSAYLAGFPGAKVGSQQRQAPGDTRPHPATIPAGEGPVGRRRAPSSESLALYGMQKVRGSNPLSSTIFRVLVRVEVTIK